jgi:hypothetical protein
MRRNVHNSDLHLTPVDGNAVRVTKFQDDGKRGNKKKNPKKGGFKYTRVKCEFCGEEIIGRAVFVKHRKNCSKKTDEKS